MFEKKPENQEEMAEAIEIAMEKARIGWEKLIMAFLTDVVNAAEKIRQRETDGE